jgi:replicative DNA helicase
VFNELPHSVDAEQTVIGALVLDGLKTERVLQAFESLVEADFYATSNREIFATISKMHKDKQVIELASVADKVSKLKPYLVEVVYNCPGAGTVDFYAEIVAQKAKERNMIQAFQMAINTLHTPEKHQDKLDAVAELLKFDSVDVKDGYSELVGDVAQRHLNTLQARMNGEVITGYQTGFYDLDDALGGLANGRLYVLGARPSVGKSALGLNIANNIIAKHGCQGAYISLEMSNEELVERLICANGKVESHKIRTMKNVEFSKLEAGMVKVCGMQMRLRVMQRPKVEQIKNFARALKRRGQLDFLVLDHLHLIAYPGQSEVQGIAHVTGELKALALELEVPVLLLAQLNRGNAKEDRLPAITDLRGSGAIEQDADCVMLLHRTEEMDEKAVAMLFVRKNRGGENNKSIPLRVNLQYFRFDNPARQDEEY